MSDFETQAIERAKRVIVICGGYDVVAGVVGRSKSRVHSWTYSQDRHGTGGIIPARCQLDLLEHARREGLNLRPDDFFPASPVKSAEDAA